MEPEPQSNFFVLASMIAMIMIALGVCLYLALRPFEDRRPPVDARYHDAALPLEERVESLLSEMTLEEKIGQMALVEKNSIKDLDDIRKYHLGAILSGAGGKPADNTKEGWREMITAHIDASKAMRTGIPILYGIDANHGLGNTPGATIFPHAIGLGATADAELVERVARATARESSAIGALWNYSPSLDLPLDARWGRVYEAFSDDSELASLLGEAYIRGLQGAGPEVGVIATAKHYTGAGSMTWGSSSNENFKIDQGVTPRDDELIAEYLAPFARAVETDVASVMVGLNSWGDTKVTASKYLITTVLKDSFGFEGFVVSDWYGVYEISDDRYASTVTAINAGVDMVMLPFDYEDFTRDMQRAVQRGDIPLERVDDAVRRIVRAKFNAGLFDSRTLEDISVIGSSEHRAIAREAVAKSVVLLKNNGAIAALKIARSINVAGSAADNIGMQSGAWTIEWQGVDGNWMPGGSSILTGIREAAGEGVVRYDRDGNFAASEKAEVGIAIVGEKPYAEGWGDNANPTLTAEDLATIERLQASSVRVIVIIISGRPLIITDEIRTWDAALAAWLPGSEGEGIADVLFGKVPFTGKLPLAWPQNIAQLPMRADGAGSDGTQPLFPRGFSAD